MIAPTPDCPLCGGATAEAFSVGDRNRGITRERFNYRRCRACRSCFLANVPSDLGRYYPIDYYQLPSPAELDRAAGTEAPKLALLRPYLTAGRLIDIGAGYGVFARAARNAGFEVTAIEMDARCCDYLENVVEVKAIRSDTPEEVLPTLAPAQVITLWHVVEHLTRPWDVLEQAASIIEPGGLLVVATPNPHSLQFGLLGARWAHVDAPRHLFLIALAALRARVEEFGLELGTFTTSDPAGRHWNVFGWEYALRRYPARHPSTAVSRTCARLLALGLAPLERRGLNGTAYTAVFVKR